VDFILRGLLAGKVPILDNLINVSQRHDEVLAVFLSQTFHVIRDRGLLNLQAEFVGPTESATPD